MTERYLVPATLTDEQCDALEEALSEAEGIRDPFDKWLVICRAIGTPVEASGLEVVGWIAPDRVSFLAQKGKLPSAATSSAGIAAVSTVYDTIPLVRRSEAETLIAARDAEIAELRARLKTVEQETREACARVCDGMRLIEISAPADWHNDACKMCAAAIRSAGEKG